MATGTPTPNLGLNVWNGTDYVLRSEMNQNFSDIDTFAGTAVKNNTANTFTANQTAPTWIASGLTGAQGTGRWVGITTSAGAPTSGTFAVGDWVVDPFTPGVWVCTSTGTPGTWGSAGKTYTAGAGISLTGTQFANTGVTSFNGQTGAVTYTPPATYNPVTSPFNL